MACNGANAFDTMFSVADQYDEINALQAGE